MGIGAVSARDLDRFVAEVDRRGGLETPDSVRYLSDFTYVLATAVDESLDPFSEAYVERQLAVYREIAGRTLDQTLFEQASFDFDRSVAGANPYGSQDPRFITPHALAVMQALWVASLPPGASVLDMGCGWGLSTEIVAFSGASATCVDINPRFLALVEERARRRGLPVRTVLSAFESLTLPPEERHDLILFYESLHHAVRPWKVIERVVPHLRAGGKVIISGEPIQGAWWRHWGLRLDPASVYCIRKFGWFESGWSKAFIARCFAQNGLRLSLVRGLSLGAGFLGIATRADERQAVDPAVRVVGAATLLLQVARAARRELQAPAGLLGRIRRRIGRRL